MSTIRVNNLQNTSTTDGGISINNSGHVTVDGVAMPSAGPLSNRNKIINGDMRIDQRNNGASVTPANNTYTIDRWVTYNSAASKYSIQQSSAAPAGFTKSALITSLSAYTVGASETFLFGQKIEGFNVADLAWGTASAKTVTLSFWVRSSLTGTFGGSFGNGADNRWYPFSYTISAANTWEQKSLTIAGDTSGTWTTENFTGINLYFNLGTGATFSGTAGAWGSTTYYSSTGATSVVGTNGATFYITGVQLEAGSVATPFEHRSYGDELARCQRYFIAMTQPRLRGVAGTSTVLNRMGMTLPTTMRIAPTSTINGDIEWYDGSSSGVISSFSSLYSTVDSVEFDGTVDSGTSAASRPIVIYVSTTSSGVLSMSAEL